MFILFFIIFIVIFISAICSLVETALFSLPISRVQVLIELKKPKSDILFFVKENLHNSITSIVILNNISNILGSLIVGHILSSLFDEFFASIISVIFLFLVIIFSEIIPKFAGEYYNEFIALYFCRSVYILTKLLTPIHRLFYYFSNFFKKSKKLTNFTENDIKIMAKLGHNAGILAKEEVNIINKALNLNNIKVRDIMTPRVRIEMLDENSLLLDVKHKILQSPFSCIPLYSNNSDKITGLLYKVDSLKSIIDNNINIPLLMLKRKVLFVPENKTLDKLLMQLKETYFHNAIVIDEYGGTAGLVTLEDVLEQLVGYIYNESSDEHRKKYFVNSKGEITVSGLTLLSDINDYFDIKLQPEHFIVSKFILNNINRFPLIGEKFEYENVIFFIDSITEKTIESVRVKLK